MSQPNIIFILMDDLGWRDLTCYGSSFYETPNLDAFATEGMRFSDAYAACPVCSPTRASILTGKYPASVGVTDWIDFTDKLHPLRGKLVEAPYIHHLPLSEKSIASALRDGGYATWHVGKWHLGGEEFYPNQHGFDVNLGGSEFGCPMQGYFSPWHLPNISDDNAGEFLPDRLTDEALKLIQNRDDKPFFLNLCYYLVHTPIQAPEDLVEKYRAKAKALGLNQRETFREGEFFATDEKRHLRVKRRLLQSDPTYAAMVESMDTNIGRLLTTLEETGLAENTLIIFTSDNGGLSSAEASPTCNAPLHEGKGWMYEGGTREPLLVRWRDKIRAGSECAIPVTSPDFYPTLLEAAGLPLLPDQHCDGMSLLPLLTEKGDLEREAIFWHYPHYGNQGGTPGSSVRCGKYKLIEFFEDGKIELYNLENDPSESNNLAMVETDTMQKLLAMLREWRQSCEAKIPAVNPNWESFDRFGGIPD